MKQFITEKIDDLNQSHKPEFPCMKRDVSVLTGTHSFLKEMLKGQETSVLTDEELLCGPAHHLPCSSNLSPIQLLD